jgi:pterin-4a-carbinolamine dehydratase
MLIYRKEIRFQGKASLINCLAYINNLIIKAILKSLSFNTYKNAYTFLNQVKENS